MRTSIVEDAHVWPTNAMTPFVPVYFSSGLDDDGNTQPSLIRDNSSSEWAHALRISLNVFPVSRADDKRLFAKTSGLTS